MHLAELVLFEKGKTRVQTGDIKPTSTNVPNKSDDR
jgi:hypothetical protein